MNNIPKALRDELASDPFYERCCMTGISKNAEKVEWHHNLIYAGKQVQAKFCILPILKRLHERAFDPEFKEQLDWIMLNRATDEELGRYSKVDDLKLKRFRLNAKFGDLSTTRRGRRKK